MSGSIDDPNISLLRPYLMTSGRAKPVDSTLEIEAQVMTSRLGAASHPKLSFERRDIVSLCRTTMSVAEVAAMLKLHIGVARVLVADLAALGYVVIRRPEAKLSQDLHMIERVIRGLESLR
jgi:phage antirepressor YoqD-like protein